ncbi:nuclear fragile X mental retardation-interacting 2-like [Pelobates cultripes]|uniref:Nuclear fragile X mental retardation-interacting 2-like n=1 Tax=Pelobates cultripes TaxID=61616 RepID=A0AAD1WJ91_PELCU|nr:nuclear fragile X mental retardation-interacting 2-like [Pelobates cultripes]
MHKEHLAQDENSNPREGPAVSRRKDRLSPCEHDMNQLNRARAKTGSWESNGFGPDPEIETVTGRTEESVPLSPSNSLNIRHLRGCEKDPAARQYQRPSYHQNHYPPHHHYRPFYPSYHRKGYWDYESQYRDGKRKEWVPRPGGGRPQRPRNREALNSTVESCADTRPEQPVGEKGKTVQGGGTGQPSAPVKEEQTAGSWLLFKPLPVFPVDSSSARTLPKISYASKVKENLDGKGLVPSSALRTSHSLPNCLLNTALEEPHIDGTCPAQSTGSLSSSSCSSLSSAPPSPVSQENLGAIFQNEWGLSFINEPGAGQALAEEGKTHECPSGGGEEGGGNDNPAVLAVGRLSVHGFYVDGAEGIEGQLENPHDWEEMVTYTSHEWNRVWNLYKKDPSRVVIYAETMDGKG